jgi:hypothetical protein
LPDSIAGEPVDAGLGRGVHGDAGEGDVRGNRGNVHHGPAVSGRAAGTHGPEGVLDAERGAEHVHVEHLADVVRVEVDHQLGDLDTGVVNEDVQAAELGDGALDGPFPARVVGHVERLEGGVAAGLLDRVDGGLAQFLADIADHHGGPGPRQRLGRAGSQAAGSSCHQGLAPGQVVHTHLASPP